MTIDVSEAANKEPGQAPSARRVAGMTDDGLPKRMDRREALKLAGATLVGISNEWSMRAAIPPARVSKRVIVAGGGIGGLSCAYELVKRGHDATVLEASGRTGGHVRTVRDPFQDGLYVDAGAENFSMLGYDLYRGYVKEFDLTPLYFPYDEIALRLVNGKWYSPEMLHDRGVLTKLGFNSRECNFLTKEHWWNLPTLYFEPYADKFKDEYKPFEAGLDTLDQMTVLDLLRKDGASSATITHIDHLQASLQSSALHAVWWAGVMKIRGVPISPASYRLKGGNQMMTDALTSRLGDRIRLGCPVTGIEHAESGVTVHYREFGQDKKMEADYVVCCMSAPILSQLAITPKFSAAKADSIRNVAYYTAARIAFQCRTPFWEKDKLPPALNFGDRNLEGVWRIADEVPTQRVLLESGGDPGTTANQALAVFRERYPGKSEDIEQAFVFDWSQDPWCTFCETITLEPGKLPKVWPRIIEPEGRIHFAGAYADNFWWGMEAATRSANRAARAIDAA